MSNGSNNGHNRNGAGNGLVHVNGNGHKPDSAIVTEHDPASSAGHDLLWDGLSPAVTKALGQPLNPALVSRRKGRGGKTFSYIEGHTAIDEANKVFGYGGWGFELVENVTLRQIETVDAQTGEVKAAKLRCGPGHRPPRAPRTDWVSTAERGTAEGTKRRQGRGDRRMKRASALGDRSGTVSPENTPRQSLPPGQAAPAHAGRSSTQSQAEGRDESQADRLRKRSSRSPSSRLRRDGVRTAVVTGRARAATT